MARLTRFTSGISTVASTDPLGQLGIADPTQWHVFFDDFNDYTAGDWSLDTLEAGAGSATEAVSDAQFGILLLTNAAGDNDRDFLSTQAETVTFTAGKKVFFECRCLISEATQADSIVGLIPDVGTTNDPIGTAPVDGIYFRKDDGDTNWDIISRDTSATVSEDTGIATATTGMVVLSFYYNGEGVCQYWVDGSLGGQLDGTATTNLLSPTFGIQNGSGDVRTMQIDYLFCAQER
jgi:hypothetical protein